jgi:uncharacterized phosphosugar-binding protein
MNKIAYLFGAGASKEALPIVNEIPDRIKGLIRLLKQDNLKLDDEAVFNDVTEKEKERTKRSYQLEMIEAGDLMYRDKKYREAASIYEMALKCYPGSVDIEVILTFCFC